jgi:heme/copper-type cytochrome/quinol oxidase subunit 1
LVIISSLSNLGYGPGWTLYANLILLIGHWDINIDLLIFSIHILGISSLLASINFIITIILTKHIGLTWYLLSLYSWSIYITSYLILVSIPILGVAVTMLLLDRNINTNYFIYENQGNVLIYQNVFWFFGHIEVNIYILSYISK